jgi:glycosyltransferase involved in cell wall biosynthesis
MEKKKILWLSDHALMHSGVATQSKYLMQGLLKTGKYSIYQLGAAKHHAPGAKTVKLSDDWIIEPVEGFGTKQQIRKLLLQMKPDLILIFTDPRFFHWLFEMEDEIHQSCPIMWWHVWDALPFPEFNKAYYDATDTLNCHSHMTASMLWDQPEYKSKTNFIPHAVPAEEFYPLSDAAIRMSKEKYLSGREDFWTLFWINKNFSRKRPGDMIYAWSLFIERLISEGKTLDVTLLMHTDPDASYGAGLRDLVKKFNVQDSVKFSKNNIDPHQLNELYNMADCTINISNAEGFGLSTLESMMTGTPIIAPLLGGQTRQVIDYRTDTENGRALPIELKSVNSSQQVPYIFDQWTTPETIADKIYEMYSLSTEDKIKLKNQVLDYVSHEFKYEDTVSKWDSSIQETLETWKSNYKTYSLVRI